MAFVALSMKIKIAPGPETGGPIFVHAERPLRAEKIAAVNRGCAVGAVIAIGIIVHASPSKKRSVII